MAPAKKKAKMQAGKSKGGTASRSRAARKPGPSYAELEPPRAPILDLPKEVLSAILEKLKNSKPTLARCMRVCPEFNEIAIPLLYERLNWDLATPCPFLLPATNARFSEGNRFTTAKEAYLGRVVKVVKTFGEHRHCKDTSARRNPPIDIDLLDNRLGRHNYHSCSALALLRPKKLVSRGQCTFSARGAAAYAGASNRPSRLVVQFGNDPAWGSGQNGTMPGYRQSPSNIPITFVFVDADRTFHFLGVPGATVLPYLESFHLGLSAGAEANEKRSLDLTEITIVNIEAAEQCMRDRYVHHEVPDLIAKMGELLANYKRERFTIKYVTKEEYIRDYDWTGEFTKEEMERWLRKEVTREVQSNAERDPRNTVSA